MPQLLRTGSRPPKGTPCGYCFQNWATGWDHLIPISYRIDNRSVNLYPSCRRCNSILGDKIFQTIEDKREYVRDRLISLGKWKTPSGEDLPSLPTILPPQEKMAEVLQQRMPPQSIPTAKKRAVKVRDMRRRVPRRPPVAKVLQHRLPLRRLPATSPKEDRDAWTWHAGPRIVFYPDGRIMVDGKDLSSLRVCPFICSIGQCSVYVGHCGDHLIRVANEADLSLDSKLEGSGTHG